MYNVKQLRACKLIAGVLCIVMSADLKNVISVQQQQSQSMNNQQNVNSDNTRRLMQYDDIPLGDQLTGSLNGASADNQSLFRAPAFQEPILEPMDPANVAVSNVWKTGTTGSPEEAITTTTVKPENETTTAPSSEQENSKKHLNTSTTSTTSNVQINSTTSAVLAEEELKHLLNYLTLNSQKLQPKLKPNSKLYPPTPATYPHLHKIPQPLRNPTTSFVVPRPNQFVYWPLRVDKKPLKERYLSPPPRLPTAASFTSKLWSFFSPPPNNNKNKPIPSNEVTRFNWVYPPQASFKKRRNHMHPAAPLVVRTGGKVAPPRTPATLTQSASHLNSYTLEPAVDTELDEEFMGSHEPEQTAYQLTQEDTVPSELPDSSSFGGASGEYPLTIASDASPQQQALLLSSLLKSQPVKKRKKIINVPVRTQQLGTNSYLEAAINSNPKLISSSNEAQTSSVQEESSAEQTTSNSNQEEESVETSGLKKVKTQQVNQQEDATTDQLDQQQASTTPTSRRKPTRTFHAVPRQKRARYPARAHRANKNLHNFYNYGPAGGDLQPSSTFLRWKYPQMYDDEEEGETELNIRFFNNFSRMGPLTGLARNAATATLIISLVLLIISNICMASTYMVHGLSALSTLFGPPVSSSSSSSSSMARPKNVTSLSYTNWESLLPPFIRGHSSTTTTTTLAPHLTSRSLLSLAAHQHPSMTFDSEIKAFGDPWT